MRRHTKTILAGAACALFVMPASPVFAQSDDQARLDGAIDAFEQRLTALGWVGELADEDEDDGVEDEGGDVTMGDDEFDECFGELAAVFEDVDDEEFPGQTAIRESLEFTFAPDNGVPATTEEFSFDFGSEETATAVAVSVDDSGLALLDSFVEQMGDKAMGDCIREAMEAEMSADSAAPDEVAMDFDVQVENEADLGIGDRSARLAFGFDGSVMGMSMILDVNMYMALVDHDLVMVMHGTFGSTEIATTLDPLAELQTLVDSL